MLPITEQQREKLKNWIMDFRVFFGWNVSVNDAEATRHVEVVANRFNYVISAGGDSLACVVVDKHRAKARRLTDGPFDFQTFGRIVTRLLLLEGTRERAQWDARKSAEGV